MSFGTGRDPVHGSDREIRWFLPGHERTSAPLGGKDNGVGRAKEKVGGNARLKMLTFLTLTLHHLTLCVSAREKLLIRTEFQSIAPLQL